MRKRAIVRGFGVGILLLIGLAAVAWWWIIPTAIVGRLEALQGGRVTIGGFWIGATSSGVTGLTFHETRADDAPIWAKAERVATDLTLGSILRGRFTPTRIAIRRPEATLRLARGGAVLTPLKFRAGAGDFPSIEVEDGRVRINQDGRPEMFVKAIDGSLGSGDDGLTLAAKTRDPMWGPWRADGRFAQDFAAGKIELSGLGVPASREKVVAIPWVPEAVWRQMLPDGPLDVRLTLTADRKAAEPWKTATWVRLRKANVTLPAFDLTVEAVQGEMTFEDGVARFKHDNGFTLEGTVGVNGTMDFNPKVPVLDLDVRLDEIAVADAPKPWGFGELELTAGRLSGQAHILGLFRPADPVDLTGSSGEAVIKGACVQGITVKSWKLQMRGEGSALKYETDEPADTATGNEAPPPAPATPDPGGAFGLGGLFGGRGGPAAGAKLLRGARALSSLAALRTLSSSSRVSVPIDSLVALQVPPSPDDPKPVEKPAIQLPKTLSSEIELEDVDLKKLVDKAERFGLKLPIDVAGRLSIRAKAKIPLGSLADLKAYRFEGEGTLAGASIGGVDLGRVEARLVLADGVLELTDFRGRLVDRPGGTAASPPEPTDPVAADGPLPAGGFRATVRAELSPKGRLTSQFAGNALPIGELAAPALPRPTPLTGLLTLDARAEADVEHLADPAAWTAAGHAESTAITYEKTTLDRVAAGFEIRDGRLTIPDLAARLRDRPLAASLGLTLKTPFDFDATVKVDDWELADALAFVPNVPKPSPISGKLRANAEATGTLAPRELRTRGDGRIAALRAEAVAFGDVPFRWDTEGDLIRAHILDAKVFGGRLSADADFPTTPDRPILGSLAFRGVDTAALAKQIPGGSLAMTGKADGRAEFQLTTLEDLEANVTLDAPELTIQGLPAANAQGSLWVRDAVLHYELGAESLGGRVKAKGEWPLADGSATRDGRVQAVGFAIAEALAVAGVDRDWIERLEGVGAIDANVRILRRPAGIAAGAVVEGREIHWRGDGDPSGGHLKGNLRVTPDRWQLDGVRGRLWGGTLTARGAGTATAADLELALDRADLARLLLPWVDRLGPVEGLGTLRLRGRRDAAYRVDGGLTVSSGRAANVPIEALDMPLLITFEPRGGTGSLQSRRWSARVAGGEVRGNLRMPLGTSRDFDGSLQLRALDLETLVRSLGVERNASGRLSGRVDWSARDATTLRGLRGKVALDLDEASLFQLPILSDVGRLLGAAQGGLFDDGDLEGTLTERQFVVEALTLEGRLVQLHAKGTVGYDQALDLEVLVATNQIIPQTGAALLGVIPGLNEVINRRDEAIARIANFLSNKLVKVRVGGTLKNPVVQADASILVTEAAVNFFAGVFRLPVDVLNR